MFPIENKGSLCRSCENFNCCPMNEMLENHRQNEKLYGKNYKDVRPDLWEEDSIDEPDIENNLVVWCSMYGKEG